MPRLDVRVKTQLPAEVFYNKEDVPIIISELSLNGALVDGLHNEHKGFITIKPKVSEYNGINLIGDVIRRFDGKSVIKFYYPDRSGKETLWNYIKEHLSMTEECPYCGNIDNLGAEHCVSCSWLLDFNDKDYLDKHDRETFTARLLNRAGSLNLEQMQMIITFMDTECLKEGSVLLHEKFADVSKCRYNVFQAKKRVDTSNVSSVHEIEIELRNRYCFESILAHHPRMIDILKLISQVADTTATVLILGESGTGKELIAQALHRNSSRKDNPFVPINCGAIPENLLETELFGHVQGAFTGAIKDKAGWFESAEGGTIFLDEVSEMPPALQVKLLRVLQTGQYSQVGSTEIRRCNVRILAATNKELKELVKEEKFREDLYYRLNVLDIELPPLRSRKCDIPLLIKHLLKIFNSKYGKGALCLTQEAETLLLAYDFPGNIRELENIIQRAVLISEGELIETYHLPASVCREDVTYMHKEKELSPFKTAKQHAIEQFEREYIIDCLKATRGNISRAARVAGINVKNFHDKMINYGIDPHSFKITIQ